VTALGYLCVDSGDEGAHVTDDEKLCAMKRSAMSRTAVPEITYFFVFKRFFLAISLLGTLVMITLCVRDVDLYFQNPR